MINDVINRKAKFHGSISNPFDRELLEVVKTGAVDRATMIADGCTNYWSFLNSYYFAGTVVTTLGYGNVYPATNPGKVRIQEEKKQ